jgi:hypothetical protein
MLLLLRSPLGGGVSRRCLVLLDGELREYPTSGPSGSRVILSSGVLTVAPAGGTSLVIDGGTIREANGGDSVVTP